MATATPTTRKAQIKALIAREVRRVFGERPIRVFLFGSQAGQPEMIAADVDVGLDAGEPLDHFQLSMLWSNLNESPETLYTFDVVDFQRVGENFRRVVDASPREWIVPHGPES